MYFLMQILLFGINLKDFGVLAIVVAKISQMVTTEICRDFVG